MLSVAKSTITPIIVTIRPKIKPSAFATETIELETIVKKENKQTTNKQ